jgi:hypothetical protein
VWFTVHSVFSWTVWLDKVTSKYRKHCPDRPMVHDRYHLRTGLGPVIIMGIIPTYILSYSIPQVHFYEDTRRPAVSNYAIDVLAHDLVMNR